MKKERKNDFSVSLHKKSNVKKVIAVISGKGGVGKSLVTSLLAAAIQRLGCHAAVIDADITGPSIPKMFGLKTKATGNENGIHPVRSKTGIDIISVDLLMEDNTEPVVWRGPLLGNLVKRFWSDVIWEDVDFLFIDMPPGTGDIPLTVFQSISVDGIIVVTSPQELAAMIVNKAVRMAEIMKVPIIGLLENMSYFRCPDNGKDYRLFGESHLEEIADRHHLPVLVKIPVDPKLSLLCDRGEIEDESIDYLTELALKLKTEAKA